MKRARWSLVVLLGCILGVAGVVSGARTALAQDCPRSAGIPDNPLATPSPTAGEVAAGTGDLGAFARAARDYFNSIRTPQELGYAACLTRNEGPWKSGSVYLVALSLDGRVSFNANDMSTGGRRLNLAAYGAILSAVGFDARDPGLPDALAGLVAGAAATGMAAFPNPDGAPVPGLGGYAVGYGSTIPYIFLAGLHLEESHFAPETLSPGDPAVSADEVVDRRTLKSFVNGAIEYLVELTDTRPAEALGIARSILRRPPWRHGEVYLFVMDPDGYTHLHGAFPDRFEFQKPTDTLRDVVTGELILPRIIEAAQRPGGGFVSYHFDNPDDHSDSVDVPKVSYARQVEHTVDVPGFGQITNAFIVGAGIYGDPVPEESSAAATEWLSRFGRVAAGQAVDMIGGRLASRSAGTAQVKIAGRTLNLEDLRSSGTPAAGFVSGASISGLEDPAAGAFRNLTARELLLGSAFHLSSLPGDPGTGGSASIWGQAASTSFDDDDLSVDGRVTTGMLGADYDWGRMLAGLALSHSAGDGGFEPLGGADPRSEMEASLTSVHPYFRAALGEGWSVWALAGYGRGDMTLEEDDIRKRVETDIAMTMGALGLRGDILAASEAAPFDLALKSDLLLMKIEADEEAGLPPIEAEGSQVRLGLEGSRAIALEQGAELRPSLELGVRFESGDAERGTGLELGGALRFTDPGSALSAELRGRGLVAGSGDDDYEEWGVGGSIRVQPGAMGRGISLSVAPSWGVVSSRTEALWSRPGAALPLTEDEPALGGRLSAELGYGVGVTGGRGLLTPYAGASLSSRGWRDWRIGGRYRFASEFHLDLQGVRREGFADDEGSAHGVMLRGSASW